MSVELVVGAIGVVFASAFLYAVVWALTRAQDRIQIATVCMLLCSLGYGALAAGAVSRQGPAGTIGLAFGVYAIVLYVVMGVLAVHHRRWAWRASIAAFCIHIALTLIGSEVLLRDGKVGLVAVVIGLVLGGTGLWACLHKGTRELVASRAV